MYDLLLSMPLRMKVRGSLPPGDLKKIRGEVPLHVLSGSIAISFRPYVNDFITVLRRST